MWNDRNNSLHKTEEYWETGSLISALRLSGTAPTGRSLFLQQQACSHLAYGTEGAAQSKHLVEDRHAPALAYPQKCSTLRVYARQTVFHMHVKLPRVLACEPCLATCTPTPLILFIAEHLSIVPNNF